MTKSEMFKKAHALTKATIKQGDNYQITFGACLNVVMTEQNTRMGNKIRILKKQINTIRFDFMHALFVGFLITTVLVCIGVAILLVVSICGVFGAMVIVVTVMWYFWMTSVDENNFRNYRQKPCKTARA